MGENRVEARKKADFWKKWGLRLIVPGLILLPLGYFFYHLLLIVGAILIFIGGVIYSRSETWEKGAEGEERVIDELEKLGDDYEIFSDLVLPGETSNIDHIVVSKYGIFVIETKNLDGLIKCNGDSWSRRKVGRKGTPYEGEIGSPSKQVKANAVKLKEFLEKKHFEVFVEKDVFFEGVVVFTDSSADLKIKNPKVEVVRVEDLNELIRGRDREVFDSEEVSKFCKALRTLVRK